MPQLSEDGPNGAKPTNGIVHRRSPFGVDDTVDRLADAISSVGAKLFAVIDHSGEAQRAGLSLRDTKLVVFGNPVAGTPVMEAAPLIAIELPLKVLVWADDEGTVWLTYLSGEWLANRHGLVAELAKALSATEVLTARVLATSS
jgi:uncharacterized protein (DUF302 family)